MEKSPSIQHLAKALLVFHAAIGNIPKNQTNPFYGSQYADLPVILKAIKEPLQQADLSFTQFPTGNNGLTTMLMHAPSGEYIQSDYFMQPLKTDPQAQGSVISYMRRYALAAVLGLNLDKDDDGNAATHGQQEKGETPAYNPQLYPAPAEPQVPPIDLPLYPPPSTPKEQTKQTGEKPWLDKGSKKYQLVVERLKNRTTTLSQVAQYFKLNKEVRAELMQVTTGALPM